MMQHSELPLNQSISVVPRGRMIRRLSLQEGYCTYSTSPAAKVSPLTRRKIEDTRKRFLASNGDTSILEKCCDDNDNDPMMTYKRNARVSEKQFHSDSCVIESAARKNKAEQKQEENNGEEALCSIGDLAGLLIPPKILPNKDANYAAEYRRARIRRRCSMC
mmetsp:Transcript_13932/g.20065  ORF Transcript_13932/g.20065 Transcript_13932/m.20065 type:complete len:162 (+) Transcript_13932:124-609(+)